jgi:hypothetical protein
MSTVRTSPALDALEESARHDIANELAHFSHAKTNFFDAWKRGVALAGPHLFGTGVAADVDRAVSIWDLCPKLNLIERAIAVMSSGEKVFLAALVSFYNTEDGGKLFKRIGVQGLADFGGLDLSRRSVLASLLLNYTGW